MPPRLLVEPAVLTVCLSCVVRFVFVSNDIKLPCRLELIIIFFVFWSIFLVSVHLFGRRLARCYGMHGIDRRKKTNRLHLCLCKRLVMSKKATVLNNNFFFQAVYMC